MRIHFSAHDLTRTRVVTATNSLPETLFAARLLGSRSGGIFFDGWCQDVRARFGRHQMHALGLLGRSLRPTAEMFTAAEDAWDTSDIALPQSARSNGYAGNLVRSFHETSIAPYWRRLREYLEAERTSRGQVLLGGGIETLLSTLHPAVTWDQLVLELDHSGTESLHLQGSGLLIVPSLYFVSKPEIFLPSDGSEGVPPVLVYSVSLAPVAARKLWNARAHEDKSLGALVGHTRASLLRALSGSRTTTELGRHLCVSPAAVSQHTGVLREAGLITTRRKQNTVWHSLTPLGVALVNQVAMTEAGVETLRPVAAHR